MKTVSDEKLNYLVRRLLERIAAAHNTAGAALSAHLNDKNNPHGVTLEQLTCQAGGSLLELTYPVGSVYISTSDVSPAELFSGSWEKLSDCFLLASGQMSLGSTGGEWAHTLTEKELPSHTHAFAIGPNGSGDEQPFGRQRTALNFSGQEQQTRGFPDSSMAVAAGGGAAHNNLPPYLAVNMWQRVA